MNIVGYAVTFVGRALVVVAQLIAISVPLMILFTTVSSFGQGMLSRGDMGAVVAKLF